MSLVVASVAVRDPLFPPPFCVSALKPRVSFDVVLYVFSLAYLVAPETFSSAHIIEIVAGLPEFIKYAGKTILAAPFAYHALNGLRHLAWDSGKFLTLKSSYAAGYAVLAGTAVSTVALILL